MSWDAVALQHGTDKASSYHGYMEHYEAWLGARRQTVRTVLEIGVLGGASLRTWAAVFPDARIIGVDVNRACWFSEGRIDVVIADATNPEQMAPVVAQGPFDLLVDDGSHHVNDVAASYQLLRPHLARGGVYAIEDTRIGPAHPSWDPAPLGEVLAVLASDMNLSRIEVVRSLQHWGPYHWQALVLAQSA